VEHKIDSLVEEVNAKMDQMENSIGRELTESLQSEEQKADQRADQLQRSIEQMAEQVGNTDQITDQLDNVKTVLAEKIHSENVQSYRNMSELVKNVDERLNKVSELEGQVKKVKNMSMGVLILTLINLAGVIVSILAIFEIFYIGLNF
jgi:uncharacterized protein YukE